MAGSYFELLTEQQDVPAMSFEPVEELRRLRRELTLRLQNLEPPEEICRPPVPKEIEIYEPFVPEPVSLETVVKQVGTMKTTLTLWQRSRSRTHSPRDGIFRARHKLPTRRYVPAVMISDSDIRGERTLEKVNVGLTALGAVGVIFGLLSFYRGWESDVSLGTLICVSGSAMIAVGLVGQILAMRSAFWGGWGTFRSSQRS